MQRRIDVRVANGSMYRRRMTLDLLRFTTAGSVDDGKSTLIGRLLYDSKQVLEDQLEHVDGGLAPARRDEIDLALLTDGLRAEREQGITIDVAYRYFKTPGGASSSPTAPATSSTRATWSPARRPPTSPSSCSTRARARSSNPSATPSSARCSASPTSSSPSTRWTSSTTPRSASRRSSRSSHPFLREARRRDCLDIPISALRGDNVVDRSERMPWYAGPTLLDPPRGGRGLLRPPLRRPGALPGPVGRAHRRQRRRVPRLRRPARERRAAQRRGGRRAALRRAHADRRDRHLRGRARARRRAAVDDAAPRGRPRRRARRADRRRRRASRPSRASSRPTSAGSTASPLRAGARYVIKHTSRSAIARIDDAVDRVDVETLERERRRRASLRSTTSAA